jgi:hypothetical protein
MRPRTAAEALTFLDCVDNVKSIHEAIARRDADSSIRDAETDSA